MLYVSCFLYARRTSVFLTVFFFRKDALGFCVFKPFGESFQNFFGLFLRKNSIFDGFFDQLALGGELIFQNC